MSVTVERTGHEPRLIPVSPGDTAATLLATVHGALALSRAIADYDVVKLADDGADAVVNEEHTHVEELGIYGCEERLVVQLKPAVAACEALEAAGVARTAHAHARVLAALVPGAEGALKRVQLVKLAGVLSDDAYQRGMEVRVTAAVVDGDREAVEWLVRAGAPCVASILDLAVRHARTPGQRLGMVELLMRHGARPTSMTAAMWRPSEVYTAAARGDAAVLEFLLAHGASPDLPNPRGRIPMSAAVGANRIDLVRILMTYNANHRSCAATAYEPSPLVIAVCQGNRVVLAALLEYGFDPDGDGFPGRETPLCCAARRGRCDLVRVLLERGASPRGRDGCGRTPLHVAVGRAPSKGSCAALLMEAGADTDAQDRYGNTPVLTACFEGMWSAVDRMLSYPGEADVRRKPVPWAKALRAAARDAPVDVVRLMVRRCAAGAAAALWDTVRVRPRLDVVKELVAAGADPAAPGLIRRADEGGSAEVVRYLHGCVGHL